MIEAIVPAAIAAVTGLGVMFKSTHSRLHEHDKRMDSIELKVAERYITRAEVTETMQRFEQHFIRIEQKIDNLKK